MKRQFAHLSGPGTHNAQSAGKGNTRRLPHWLALLAITALLAVASPAFAKTDQTASPPAIKSTADQIIAHVPDTVPLQGAVTMTVGHPNAIFVANTGYQTAFLEGLPVSFGSKNIIAATSPQAGTGYANQAASQQIGIGEIGTNLGGLLESPPATLIAVVATQADTGLGAFAFSS